jgi:hypothetical protein
MVVRYAVLVDQPDGLSGGEQLLLDRSHRPSNAETDGGLIVILLANRIQT